MRSRGGLRGRLAAVGVAAAVVCLGTLTIVGSPPASAKQPGHGPPTTTTSSVPFVVNAGDTYQVAQETGTGSINHTDTNWDVYGSDLGNMFLYQGHTYLAFGDTFGGPAADPFFSVPHTDWRSNTMAYDTSTAPPTAGIPFSGMITDTPGHAKELLSSLHGQTVNGVTEQTVIPTYGVAIGSRMYLYYMSVQSYGAPGHWTLNYSGIAYSDDGGQTWTKDMAATWPGDSNFGQVALVAQPDGYLYVYGIPGGRYGALQLARVPQSKVLNTAAYQYWNGKRWVTGKPQAATDIVPAPVGELSVRWNSYYKQWLMTYLVDPTGQVVLRMSPSLTGPWGPAQVVVTGAQYRQLYAPYLTPLWDNGPDIWFTMSLYGPYHVVLMHTSLLPASSGAQPTLAAPATPGVTTPRATYPFAHGRGSTTARR